MFTIVRYNLFEEMITYISTLFACFSKAITYKKGSALLASFGSAIMLTSAENIWQMEFFGISYSFLMLAVGLIMLDFLTGAIASRYEMNNADGWFQSEKITLTVYKFLSIFLLLWIASELHKVTLNAMNNTDKAFWKAIYGSALSTVSLARTTVFALICGREYISLGENIYRRFGKKFYCFVIFEKLFDVLEGKFIKKIEGTACPDNKGKKDENNKEL